MNTPTPRTDAVYLEHRYWANEDEATEAIEDFRDFARALERELAAEVEKANGYINLQVARAERAEAEVKRLGHLEAVLRSSAADMTAGNITAGGVADLRAENERLRRAYVRPDDIRVQLESAIARAERAEAELKEWSVLNLWGGTPEIIHNFVKGQQARIHAAQDVEAELAGIRALADRRNERDHSQDTTHQLVAALDQALDIAQAELAQFRELDAERARMRQIAVDKRIRTPTPRTDEEAGSLIDAEEVVPADFARELERELSTERARLDWLESVMAPDANYCEVFFAGLRNWTGSAHAFQIESNPRKFPTLNAPTVRAAIDAAMKEGA